MGEGKWHQGWTPDIEKGKETVKIYRTKKKYRVKRGCTRRCIKRIFRTIVLLFRMLEKGAVKKITVKARHNGGPKGSRPCKN